jgi:hypothetical protein
MPLLLLLGICRNGRGKKHEWDRASRQAMSLIQGSSSEGASQLNRRNDGRGRDLMPHPRTPGTKAPPAGNAPATYTTATRSRIALLAAAGTEVGPREGTGKRKGRRKKEPIAPCGGSRSPRPGCARVHGGGKSRAKGRSGGCRGELGNLRWSACAWGECGWMAWVISDRWLARVCGLDGRVGGRGVGSRIASGLRAAASWG